MNTARSFAVIAFVGLLALSSIQVSFGQAPAGAGGGRRGPQPTPADATQGAPADAGLVPVGADDPPPGAPVQPLPPAPVQPLPAAGGPAAPFPVAPVPPVGAQPLPVPGVQPFPAAAFPSLTLVRGSHIIGSRAILYGGVLIGTVQDLLSVAGSGEYVLVANPSGFVTIPRSLTFFDPVRRVLRVNMTFAQVGELPRLLQLALLNRQFLERVHHFFRTPQGLALLQNGVPRDSKAGHSAGGAHNRAVTRTAGKPASQRQTRTEPHAENGSDLHR